MLIWVLSWTAFSKNASRLFMAKMTTNITRWSTRFTLTTSLLTASTRSGLVARIMVRWRSITLNPVLILTLFGVWISLLIFGYFHSRDLKGSGEQVALDFWFFVFKRLLFCYLLSGHVLAVTKLHILRASTCRRGLVYEENKTGFTNSIHSLHQIFTTP